MPDTKVTTINEGEQAKIDYAKKILDQFIGYFENQKMSGGDFKKIPAEVIQIYEFYIEDLKKHYVDLDYLDKFQTNFLEKLKSVTPIHRMNKLLDFILIREPESAVENQIKMRPQIALQTLLFNTVKILHKITQFKIGVDKVVKDSKVRKEEIERLLRESKLNIEKTKKEFEDEISLLDEQQKIPELTVEYGKAYQQLNIEYQTLLKSKFTTIPYTSVEDLIHLVHQSYAAGEKEKAEKNALIARFQEIKKRSPEAITPASLDEFSFYLKKHLESRDNITKSFLSIYHQLHEKKSNNELKKFLTSFENISKDFLNDPVIILIQQIAPLERLSSERIEKKANLENSLRDQLFYLNQLIESMTNLQQKVALGFPHFEALQEEIRNLEVPLDKNDDIHQYYLSLHFILSDLVGRVITYPNRFSEKLITLYREMKAIKQKIELDLQDLLKTPDSLTAIVEVYSQTLDEIKKTEATLGQLFQSKKSLDKKFAEYFIDQSTLKEIDKDITYQKNLAITELKAIQERVKQALANYSADYYLEYGLNDEETSDSWMAWHRKASGKLNIGPDQLINKSFIELEQLKIGLSETEEEITSLKLQLEEKRKKELIIWKHLNDNIPLSQLTKQPLDQLVIFLKIETKQYADFLKAHSKSPFYAEKIPVLDKIAFILQRNTSLDALHEPNGLTSKDVALLSKVYTGGKIANFFKRMFSFITFGKFDKKDTPVQKIFIKKLLTLVPQLSITNLEKEEAKRAQSNVKNTKKKARFNLSNKEIIKTLHEEEQDNVPLETLRKKVDIEKTASSQPLDESQHAVEPSSDARLVNAETLPKGRLTDSPSTIFKKAKVEPEDKKMPAPEATIFIAAVSNSSSL